MSKDFSNESVVPAGPAASQKPSKQWLVALLALLAIVVLFYAAEISSGLIISIYPVLHHWSSAQSDRWLSNSVGAQFSYGLLADGLIVAGIAWMLRLFHWQWSSIGLKMPKIRHIAYGLLAAIPYYILYIIAVIIISAIIPALNVNQTQQIGFNSVHGVLPIMLAFVSLVVVPPLAEEIAMRGFLYTGLRKWLPKIVSALIVSALFGAAHLAEGGSAGPLWIGAMDTFILSLVLVFLREKTGNLWAGITLHALKNGIAFISLFIVAGR
jgi:membrane protease YdiL (CAAX protease family)